MLYHSSYRFFSQTTPPSDAQEPAYWFLFQGDKLLVRPGADTVELPLARDPSELAVTPLRRQYLGYLLDGQERRIACYCAEREVFEEVGIRIQNIRYFGSQPWPFPNSLMLGFTAEYAGGEFVLEEGEIAEAGWFAADAMPQLPPKMSISRRLIDWFIEQNHPQGAAALRDNTW